MQRHTYTNTLKQHNINKFNTISTTNYTLCDVNTVNMLTSQSIRDWSNIIYNVYILYIYICNEINQIEIG